MTVRSEVLLLSLALYHGAGVSPRLPLFMSRLSPSHFRSALLWCCLSSLCAGPSCRRSQLTARASSAGNER